MEWGLITSCIFNIIIIIIACFFTPGYNFFLKMISIDSLFSAAHYLLIFINKNMTENQVMDYSSALYKGSALDRYIYYGLQYLTYTSLNMIFWVDNISPLYYVIIMTLSPTILNKILESKLYDIIRNKKEMIVKKIIAKQFAAGISYIAKIYLNKDVTVKHKEILPLLDNYMNTISYFTEVLKNTLIVLLLSCVKSYSPNFYYRVTKYFIGYKTGDMLVSFNGTSARETIRKMIDNKKWEELLKPNVYRAIFHLYQTTEDSNMNFFQDIILDIKQRLVKMGCIWTLSSFFNRITIAPVMSLFMILYRSNFPKANEGNYVTYQKIGALILGSIVGYFSESYVLMSFLCQFTYFILINKISVNVVKFLIRKIVKKVHKINNINSKYIVPICGICLYTVVFGYIINTYTIILVTMHLIYETLTNYDIRRIVIFCYLLTTGYRSAYNILHVMFNSFVIYLLFALLFNKNNDDEDVFNKIITYVIINVRNILDNINIYKIKDDTYNEYVNIKQDCKVFVRNIYKKRKKINDIDNVYELLNTEEFPSVSLCMNKKDQNKICKDDYLDRISYIPINNQLVIKQLKSKSDPEYFNNTQVPTPDRDIFNLPADDFIEAISANTNNNAKDKPLEMSTSLDISNKSNKSSKTSKTSKTNIIENFY